MRRLPGPDGVELMLQMTAFRIEIIAVAADRHSHALRVPAGWKFAIGACANLLHGAIQFLRASGDLATFLFVTRFSLGLAVGFETAPLVEEIGSASCRERVCQYVRISGGA